MREIIIKKNPAKSAKSFVYFISQGNKKKKKKTKRVRLSLRVFVERNLGGEKREKKKKTDHFEGQYHASGQRLGSDCHRYFLFFFFLFF